MKLWKKLVGLFFLLVIIDGALRKWAFPGLATPLLVLKDVVLWGGFLLYAMRRNPFALPRPLKKTWVPTLLGAYVFVVLLQAFNINQPNLIVSAIGLKAHLAYVPLVVLLPAFLAQATERQVLRGLWGYGIFIYLPFVALCIYQFFQPPTAWVNQYVREMGVIATVGDYPRITGTFSYIGSLTPYLRFSAFLGAGVLLAGLRWKQKRLSILGGLLFGGTLIILPMPGSRAPVLLVAGGLVPLLLIVRFKAGQRFRILAAAVLITVLAIQGLGGSGLFEGWGAIAERTQGAGTEEAEGRIVGVFTGPLTGLEEAGLLGYGVGTNNKAAPRFVSVSDWRGRLGGDRPGVRVIAELGILGWLVLVALKLALLYLAYETVRRSQSPVELIVGITAFCMLLNHLIVPFVFRLVANALYWGSAGTMLGIWSLQEQRAMRDSERLKKMKQLGR